MPSHVRRLLGALLVMGGALLACDGGSEPAAPPPAPPAVASIVVSPDSAVLQAVGQTVQFTATARTADGAVSTSANIAWTSSDPAVATVNATGLATAAHVGQISITASVGSISGSSRLTVSVRQAYFVCDCATGADGNCVSGNDTATGRSPITPWRTYNRAQDAWSTLAAGDTLSFCAGGVFPISGEREWVNPNCRAASPCVVNDYAAPWASGDEERPRLTLTQSGHAFDLANGGHAEHEEGYRFQNLQLECTVCASTLGWGFFLYNDIDDVVIDNVLLDGFEIGVHLSHSNPCSADPQCDGRNERITLSNSSIINSATQGWLGSGNGAVIENNYFENNGTRPVLDHNIYFAGIDYTTLGARITGNELYRSALDESGSCDGVSLVVHGAHDDLLIEGNLIREDVGRANERCWGIAVDPGLSSAEGFERLVIRGNRVFNVGNLSIGVASCVNCVIENNVVVNEQMYGIIAIAAPDRDRESNDLPSSAVTIRNNSIFISQAAGGGGIRAGGEGTGHVVVSNAIHYAGTAASWYCLDADLSAGGYDAIGYNVCAFPDAEEGLWERSSGTAPDPLTAWRGRLGFGTGAQRVLPGFGAPGGPVFNLQATSQAAAMVGAGHPVLSAPTDFLGRARGTRPDAGAYQKQ